MRMISIIIVNYYSAAQTERAVGSVLEGGGEKEIIVVDNSCSFKERTALDQMQERLGFSLIINEENVGFAKACNQAFSRSKGDYIFLLNPDAFVAPSCLHSLKDFLENTPSAGAASPQVYWDDGMNYSFPRYSIFSPFQDLCMKLSSLSRVFAAFYSLHERSKNVSLWKSAVPVKVMNLHGGAVMIRRSAAEEAGGLFDERFFLFFEDTDLFFRMRRKAYDLYIIPIAKAVHNYSHGKSKLEYMAETRRLYYEKHFRHNILLKAVSFMPDNRSKKSYRFEGLWNRPPSFHVPEAFQGGYLFEWSPSPVFMPAIGYFGNGETFRLPQQLWDLLGEGEYYSRFSPSHARTLKNVTSYWTKIG